MRNPIAAEWTKLIPHKGTWLLVWIYPVLFLIVLTIAIFAEGKNPDAMTATGWIDDTTMIWYVPMISLGRYFIAAYFGLVFAGEYGWNTWKLVVPHAARWKLLGSKYAVVLTLLFLSWIATALISIAMQYVRTAVVGAAVPDGVTFGSLLAGHYQMVLLAIAPLLITAAYATTAAILTRSTLATIIIALVLVTLDEIYGKLTMWLSSFGMEWPALIYRILPGYHLQNLSSWMRDGDAVRVPLETGTVIAYSYGTSFLALTAWILGLAAVTLFWFRRQDIN